LLTAIEVSSQLLFKSRDIFKIYVKINVTGNPQAALRTDAKE
jgi:hypothetical protein